MRTARLIRQILVLFFALYGPCACLATGSQLAIAPPAQKFHLDAGTQFLDSGIDLNPGDQISLRSSGTLNYQNRTATPDGIPRGFLDLLRALPLNSAGTAAMIGRIGGSEASDFLVGSHHQQTVSQAGRLYLGINRLGSDSFSGPGYDVTVQITRSASSSNSNGASSGNNHSGGASAGAGSIVELPAGTFKFPEIPARVSDGKGHDGDMVNLLLTGTQEQVLATFMAAQWEQSDKSIKDAVLHGVLSTLSKEAYLALPMSNLVLFGRTQDLSLERAETIAVAASRHHLRLWKASFLLNGEQVWVGAATHDIGFDRDARNNGITHKIDPDVDLERAYVRDSLWSTGLVEAVSYYLPAQPVTTAKTATGAEFHSDGRVLVLKMKGPATHATGLARNFCSVLANENPDGGRWSACGSYLGDAPTETAAAPLAALTTDMPVLILPGFFSDCLSTSQPFHEALEHLKSAHHIKGEYLDLKNLSSAENASLIAAYINSHFDGTHKYLVIGYSKGAADGYEALATFPELQTKVAAFVSVAGAVGGSRLIDVLPGGYAHWLTSTYLQCQGDLTGAIDSLSYRNRQKFLADYPSLGVPSYTVVAQVDRAHASTMMAQTWQVMSIYEQPQDGQLLTPDATIPGSQFLGAAATDHLAIAINFATTTDIPASMRNHNEYPRAALLEAVVRVVLEDLGKAGGRPQ
ncbi:MAG TPA: LssY C-terminal domain-containing protein [Candidatus Saccharimonadales bacterium]|jgi:pimeloyl-ACP methyl ester carboxylesterase|nr:LssY C-terminal domain-containing protein [Candidatus Saccharimonadales bacterium]